MDPITPITDRNPVCFGVCCDCHHACQRYEAVNHASETQPRICNCSHDGGRTYPLFVAKTMERAAA